MSERIRIALSLAGVAAVAGGFALRASASAPAVTTCADAGVLLARLFSTDDALQSKHETEIAKACTDAAWPQTVLDCLGDTIDGAEACVEKLPHDAQLALANSVTPPPKPPEPEPAPAAQELACTGTPSNAMAYGIDAPGDDGMLILLLRRWAFVQACREDRWPENVKQCFANAKDGASVAYCATKLPEDAAMRATAQVGGADALAARAIEAMKTPAKITCAKVVAAHYGDSAWKDKLSKLSRADRVTVIAASRKQMTKDCATWAPKVRACLTVGGGYPQCSGDGPDLYSFPALGVFVPTGVKECDRYERGLLKLAECPAAQGLALSAWNAASTMTEWQATSPDMRTSLASVCATGYGAVADAAKGFGCKL